MFILILLFKHFTIYLLKYRNIYKPIHPYFVLMVKLQFDNNKQYKITLPKALIEALRWKKGDEVDISLNNKGEIVLKVKKHKR